jgi:hypothetical protein
MRVRIHETHHRSRSENFLGVAGGKKKTVLVLQTSQGDGWTDGGTERGMVTCRPFRSHKDSALCLRSFLASAYCRPARGQAIRDYERK